MDKTNKMNTGEAMKHSGVSRPTIIAWCENFGIGIKIGGRWTIYKDQLEKVLSGETHYPSKRDKGDTDAKK